MKRQGLKSLYNTLISVYGPQGWWPIRGRYHRGDYEIPQTPSQRFEVIVGAILTQNTAWNNVRIALDRLFERGVTTHLALTQLSDSALRELIRPSGYYNQKARKLRVISRFVLSLNQDSSNRDSRNSDSRDRNSKGSGPGGTPPEGRIPKREELLGLWGVGPETADSILLYVYKQPTFVIDAYTRRFLSRMGVIGAAMGYEELRELFMKKLPKDHRVYNEYHALCVQHAKEFCGKVPLCSRCPVSRSCSYGST